MRIPFCKIIHFSVLSSPLGPASASLPSIACYQTVDEAVDEAVNEAVDEAVDEAVNEAVERKIRIPA